MQKEIIHKQQESSQKPRKIFCLKRAYVVTMNLKFFKELCGGLWLFTLVLELVMSREDLNEAMLILTEIEKPTMKYLFGMQKEAPKHAMVQSTSRSIQSLALATNTDHCIIRNKLFKKQTCQQFDSLHSRRYLVEAGKLENTACPKTKHFDFSVSWVTEHSDRLEY